MTVRELIGRLRSLPEDLPVLVPQEYGLDDVLAVQQVQVVRYIPGRGFCAGRYVEYTPWTDGVPTEGEPLDAVLISSDPARSLVPGGGG